MCGICGIYNLDGRPVDKGLLQRMNNTLVHRGPDDEGYYLSSKVGLGHRRLSIIDLDTGKQPMGNEDGSIQVVFNGEIYNFLELKKDLQGKGYHFRTGSDTETIIYGYEEWGEDFVRRIRGMFAIALWDARRQKLLLIRDRMGKKPLYYYRDKDRILFASELKALLEDKRIPRDIDQYALDSYLSFGYVPSPLSIFSAIRKLPPAHLAVQSPGAFLVRQYWHLDMEREASPGSEEEVLEELRSLFDEAVRLRLISDVPLGAFLSGGVDSSAVVASMAGLMQNEPVKTASIGFSDKKFDELEYARVVANRYRTDHTEFVVNPDAPEVLDDIVWHLDEPFADASAIPTYYVSKMARRKVTVVLSGDGGDETFAGYIQRYHMNRLEDHIRKKIPPFFRQNIFGPIARAYPKADFLPRPLRLKCFLSNLSLELEQAYFRDMSFYFLPEMKKKLYREQLSSELKHFNAFDILGKHFKANQNPDVTTRVQYVDIMTYLPEDILVKVDRMSMAHSLEVRSPILDHKLMEFVGRLPSSYKLRGSESKYIFKKMNENVLPRDILYRKKQGFCVPLAAWLRGDLKEFARETLFSSESSLGNYFNVAYVKDLWRRHQGGRQDYSAPLWGLMMFELWHRAFMS
ncbi:MAG: asparagine synthase (glutamine-hydrolyzing) [Candidatus Latescibacteria bacterium]|nr:asparagine synthase (glutamine-hydrolyzing) [Candidatus Latescibacterota bacterium]